MDVLHLSIFHIYSFVEYVQSWINTECIIWDRSSLIDTIFSRPINLFTSGASLKEMDVFLIQFHLQNLCMCCVCFQIPTVPQLRIPTWIKHWVSLNHTTYLLVLYYFGKQYLHWSSIWSSARHVARFWSKLSQCVCQWDAVQNKAHLLFLHARDVGIFFSFRL